LNTSSFDTQSPNGDQKVSTRNYDGLLSDSPNEKMSFDKQTELQVELTDRQN
jgi:hypothetical protein